MLQSLPNQKREFSVEGARSYDRSSPMRWILSHLLQYKGLLLTFVFAALLTNIFFAAIPRLTGLAFDEILKPEPSAQRLVVLAGIILVLVLVRGVIDLTNSWSIETLGQRLERDARDELYMSLLGKSQTFHNRQRVGDIMARASNDVRQLNPMINPGVALITESMIGIVVPLVFIALLKVQLLLAPVLFVISYYFSLRHYMKQLNPISGAIRRQFGVMNAGLNETITGIEVVKSMVQEVQEKNKFTTNAAGYRDYFIQEGKVQARYLPLLFLGFAATGAFAHGLYLVSKGQLSIGQLVAYVGLVGVLRFPAFISIFSFSLVQLGLAGAKRILELMREETELDENVSGHAADIGGEIVFDKVSFGYTNENKILRDISFQAVPGETIAIVGQTGSGKSTLSNLVNRIYDVSEGRILIDGIDVRNWNLERLRSQISVIEQDVFLFSRSIADNISFGLGQKATRGAKSQTQPPVGGSWGFSTSTTEAIQEAAKAAQAHDFIMSFRDGYDTVIGERGVTLSGGQRQRLAIARALLTDPRILILDDSTSAIDSRTEDEIQKAINKVLEGRTTFIITHRLSQIRRADKILVLHQGELIDQGKHEDLLERCALYKRIFAKYD